MSRFNIKLNGWDCSKAFHKWGVYFRQIKVEGPNSDVSQGGTAIVDLVKVKDYLSLTGNAVDRDTFGKLSALARQDYITAIYEHPETGEEVTKVMIPSLSDANRKPMHGGALWFDGWTLTLEER